MTTSNRGFNLVPPKPPVIDSFTGTNFFLSNFYPIPIKACNGQMVKSLEHAYMMEKCDDPAYHAAIMAAPTAARAKAIGGRASFQRNGWRLKPEWNDAYRKAVMDKLLDQKFNHPDLGGYLLDTGYVELIEGNFHGDTFFGVCRGIGRNELGKSLMAKRQRLRPAQVEEYS